MPKDQRTKRSQEYHTTDAVSKELVSRIAKELSSNQALSDYEILEYAKAARGEPSRVATCDRCGKPFVFKRVRQEGQGWFCSGVCRLVDWEEHFPRIDRSKLTNEVIALLDQLDAWKSSP